MKKIISFVGIAFYVAVLQAQTWIWYPGDYEIWLGNRMNNRRTERGAFFPPFWKTDSHYVVIEFSKQVDLERAENIFITAEGKYNVKLDGKLQFGMPSTLTLPAGTQFEYQSLESGNSSRHLCRRKDYPFRFFLESYL